MVHNGGRCYQIARKVLVGRVNSILKAVLGVCKTLKEFCGQRMGSRRLKDALLRKNTILCFSDSMLGVCSS